jgi:F-type H+-transporting ATPase subunit b
LILKRKNHALLILLFLGVLTCIVFQCPYAFGAGELSPGRRLWDNLMLWVNFGILVFLFFRYAKKPLMDYLRGVRQDIEKQMNAIAGDYNSVKIVMDEEAKKLNEIDQKLEEIRQNMLDMGKREKEKIIEQGKIAAEKMIQDAKRYSRYKMAMAKKVLSYEMIDLAISMAQENIAKRISEEDNEEIINHFLTDLGALRRHFG